MGKYPYYKHLYETLIHMSHGLFNKPNFQQYMLGKTSSHLHIAYFSPFTLYVVSECDSSFWDLEPTFQAVLAGFWVHKGNGKDKVWNALNVSFNFHVSTCFSHPI